ncbi:MAG: TIGR03089 family protein [Rothia sp. (in: high G+C Gram-positive bacteria)]|uniref:TIGR03089 family protein n=1 Tax=Rothia sp. (in: high G+C Gram-positive bacteria) TaxID=1885016 RepID=UPI0026DF6FFD|nr:TIGR03089 family protein [Rothia sp. (in: high G+C Gram-positive bacteria)]MDO5750302.1 TIGR03089 family protein [Rothia sp. (in: high G+C Gram-positive bacteria)]
MSTYPASFASFCTSLAARQSPALIWYSRYGERIELSGRVLMNWVEKSTNFLVSQTEVNDEEGVYFAPVLHWRSVVLALSSLRAGAQISSIDNEPVAVIVYEPDQIPDPQLDALPAYAVAVDRSPLAMRFMGHLELFEQGSIEEVLDYCALVRSESDVLMSVPAPVSARVDEEETTQEVFWSRVCARANELPASEALAYALPAEASFDTPAEIVKCMETILAIMLTSRAVVICDPAANFSPSEIEPLLTAEQALVL